MNVAHARSLRVTANAPGNALGSVALLRLISSATSGAVVVRDRLCRIWQLNGWAERRFVRPGAGSLGLGAIHEG
jgi:hypothetical protein